MKRRAATPVIVLLALTLCAHGVAPVEARRDRDRDAGDRNYSWEQSSQTFANDADTSGPDSSQPSPTASPTPTSSKPSQSPTPTMKEPTPTPQTSGDNRDGDERRRFSFFGGNTNRQEPTPTAQPAQNQQPAPTQAPAPTDAPKPVAAATNALSRFITYPFSKAIEASRGNLYLNNNTLSPQTKIGLLALSLALIATGGSMLVSNRFIPRLITKFTYVRA